MTTKAPHCLPSDCAHCSACPLSVFSQLDMSELMDISTSKSTRVYERGEMLYLAGERPSGVYCISTGRVKVYKIGSDAREQILRLAGPGDMIGYRCLISGEVHSTYAEPMTSSRICHIPRNLFLSLIASSFRLSSRVMKLLSSQLEAADDKIVDLAQHGVATRVAEMLLILMDSYGLERDGMTIKVRMTRLELASLIGAVKESVSRQLGKLKQEGAIDLVGRRIKILDLELLVKAAQQEN